jgi:hypothetical protein
MFKISFMYCSLFGMISNFPVKWTKERKWERVQAKEINFQSEGDDFIEVNGDNYVVIM